MSINDPISIIWDTKKGKYYIQQGRETFYDSNNLWLLFDTYQQAAEYVELIRTGHVNPRSHHVKEQTQ